MSIDDQDMARDRFSTIVWIVRAIAMAISLAAFGFVAWLLAKMLDASPDLTLSVLLVALLYLMGPMALIAFSAPIVAGYGFRRPDRRVRRLHGLGLCFVASFVILLAVGLFGFATFVVYGLVMTSIEEGWDPMDLLLLMVPAVSTLAAIECARWAMKLPARSSSRRRMWLRCRGAMAIIGGVTAVLASGAVAVGVVLYLIAETSGSPLDRYRSVGSMGRLVIANVVAITALLGGLGLSRIAAGVRPFVAHRRRLKLVEGVALICGGGLAVAVWLIMAAIYIGGIITSGLDSLLPFFGPITAALFCLISGVRLVIRRSVVALPATPT